MPVRTMTSSNATPGSNPALNLRPLSLGEVFDRAFNLYFTHIATFTALIAVVIVPMALMSYFQTRDLFDFYVNLFQQVRAHPGTPPDTSQLEKLQPNLPLTAGIYVFALFGLPFAQAAAPDGLTQ